MKSNNGTTCKILGIWDLALSAEPSLRPHSAGPDGSNIHRVMYQAFQSVLTVCEGSLRCRDSHQSCLQGRYDLALSIQLRLRSPKVFDFIRAHGLLPQLPSRVPQLLRIDAAQAIHLLVEEREAVSPSAVVPAIQVSHPSGPLPITFPTQWVYQLNQNGNPSLSETSQRFGCIFSCGSSRDSHPKAFAWPGHVATALEQQSEKLVM